MLYFLFTYCTHRDLEISGDMKEVIFPHVYSEASKRTSTERTILAAGCAVSLIHKNPLYILFSAVKPPRP